MTAFVKIMRDTAAGVPYSETEFRIKDIADKYYWCRIRATAQFNADGHPIKAVGVIVDIDSEKRQKQALLDMAQKDALTGLYNKATINTLVEQQMKGRAFIFESSEDRKCCSNTFEWCASGVEPQIATLQNISYVDDLGDYLRNFDQKGLFYCAQVSDTHPDVRAVLEPQGIRSMLQCAMLDEGYFVGYVGFDECRENRVWSARQVATFKLTADVISTFIMKLRQKQGRK